jgi:VanZ family protein
MIGLTTRAELRYPGVWRSIGWCLLALVVYLSVTPSPPGPSIPGADKAGHFIAYFTLMIWFLQLYRASGWWRLALSFFLLGVALEAVQGLGTIRTPDLWDVAWNTLGVLVAWMLGGTPVGLALRRLESRLVLMRSG